MTSFENLKHKEKKLQNVHDNILELKVHFESKLSLIHWLNEEDWIKSMCIKNITYIFLMAIGRMFVIHDTLPNQINNNNNNKYIQCPPIKSF